MPGSLLAPEASARLRGGGGFWLGLGGLLFFHLLAPPQLQVSLHDLAHEEVHSLAGGDRVSGAGQGDAGQGFDDSAGNVQGPVGDLTQSSNSPTTASRSSQAAHARLSSSWASSRRGPAGTVRTSWGILLALTGRSRSLGSDTAIRFPS